MHRRPDRADPSSSLPWISPPVMTPVAELLSRHVPLVRYDSRERFFADAVELWLEHRPAPGGEALAGASARATLARYREQRSTAPGARDRVYGHAATGRDGRTWLAYWFFYVYNDYRLLGPWLGAGLHEGDWEMIQLRLDAAGLAPDLAVCAQHHHADARPWDRVERVGDQPVIYPARGSHACYFTPGTHWTGLWIERADGKGPSPPLTLEVIEDDDPRHGWARSAERWGTTRPRPGVLGLLDSISPHGPGHQRQWHDPARLLDDAKPSAGPRGWQA